MSILFVKKISTIQQNEFADLAYEAFLKKIRHLWLFNKTEGQAKQFLTSAAIFENGVYALLDDTVVGYIALDKRDASFFKYELKNFTKIFGKWGGLWRYAFHKIVNYFETPLNDNEAKVEMIAVNKSVRGQGIGEQLLLTAFEQVKKENISKIFLEVVDTNPKAKKLYERLGFSTLKVDTLGKITQKAGFSKVYLMCKEI